MNGFIGTRAEREWLAVAKRIADALERLADQMEEQAEAPDRNEDEAGKEAHDG